MKIVDVKNLVYIRNIGFVSKFKIGMTAFLLSVAILVFFDPGLFLTDTNASQATEATLVKYISKKDRMVSYMQDMNHTLPSHVAYNLADAILAQEEKYKIPSEVQLSLIKHESRFEQYAISQVGALGFYQVMANYHADKVSDFYKHGDIVTKNVYDPLTNASLGAKILSDCLQSKHNNLSNALACYNGTKTAGDYSKSILDTAKVVKAKILAIDNKQPKMLISQN